RRGAAAAGPPRPADADDHAAGRGAAAQLRGDLQPPGHRGATAAQRAGRGPVTAGSAEGGIRTPRESPDKTAFLAERGARSGALAAEFRTIDPDLSSLIDAWPALSEPIRACAA